jgi:hypothetical protein
VYTTQEEGGAIILLLLGALNCICGILGVGDGSYTIRKGKEREGKEKRGRGGEGEEGKKEGEGNLGGGRRGLFFFFVLFWFGSVHFILRALRLQVVRGLRARLK